MADIQEYICHNLDSYIPPTIINITVSVCGMIISTIIMFHAFIQLAKQTKMEQIFKTLFWFSAVFTIVTLITSCTSTVFCITGKNLAALISTTITIASYFLLLLTVLTTLLARLKYTFYGSIYELSKSKRNILLTLYLIALLSITAAVVLFLAIGTAQYINRAPLDDKIHVIDGIIIGLSCLGGIFYLFTATWSCIIFVNKLIKIANLGATSMTDLQQNNVINGLELNEKQQKLVNSISRYVSLFSIAIITSIATMIVIALGRWWIGHALSYGQVMMIVSGIDAILNLICLYLQYQFNVKYYTKYCRCLERCWKPLFVKTVKRNMYETQKQKQSQMAPLKIIATDSIDA